MTSNHLPPDTPNAMTTPGAGLIRSACGQMRHAARDVRGFLRLLARTLGGLPIDVLGASIIINVLGLALPLAILQVYDRIVPNAAASTLTLLMLGVFASLVLETALRVARAHVIGWAGMKLAWNASVEAASRIALAPPEMVDSEPAARWLQRLTAVSTLSEFHVSPSPLVLIDLVFAVIFLAVLVAGGGWLAAVPVAIFAFCGLIALRRGRELREATAGRIGAEARIRDFLMEVMGGIVTVRALGAEQQILRRFERLSQQTAAHTGAVVRLADDAQSFAASVSSLTQISTATLGAVLAIRGDISVGVVACSTMLAGRVIQPLLRLVSAWNEIQAVMVAQELAKPVFALPRGARATDRTQEAGRQAAGLTFDAVWYAYGENQPCVLCGASLEIRPGEIVAITGGDSIGKSTVARLAAGQIAAMRGALRLGGEDLSAALALDPGAVAIVDSRNAIMRGSVLSNLTMFRDAERLEAAIEAVRLIGLEGDIARLPRGYDTPLGGAASETLPTSFLQRIAVARAITGSPRLLVLDEVNNSFDHAGETALSQALQALRGRMTVLIITNRPSFAAIANRQFTLSGGAFRQIVPAASVALRQTA